MHTGQFIFVQGCTEVLNDPSRIPFRSYKLGALSHKTSFVREILVLGLVLLVFSYGHFYKTLFKNEYFYIM